MPQQLPRKALIAVTSAHPPFYPDGKRTGLFYSEALHPFEELTRAGFEVDLASETGACALDEHSLERQFLTDEDYKILHNSRHPFNEKVQQQVYKAGDLAPHDYGLFFAAGGHAASYDFPHARHLQAIAEDVYNRGGVVSAVCHGPAILPAMHLASGEPLIHGKTITGFSTKGEVDMKLIDKIRSDNLHTLEELAVPANADFVSPGNPYEDFIKIDGRVVTGANPASARSTARNAIKVFQGAAEEP